jgi:hypothetical protein
MKIESFFHRCEDSIDKQGHIPEVGNITFLWGRGKNSVRRAARPGDFCFASVLRNFSGSVTNPNPKCLLEQ